MPMVLVASGIAAANAYGFMPVVRQSGDEILNIWLQVRAPVYAHHACAFTTYEHAAASTQHGCLPDPNSARQQVHVQYSCRS